MAQSPGTLAAFTAGLATYQAALAARARRGDLQALQQYAAYVGESLSQAIQELMVSDYFLDLDNKDRAEIVRYQAAPVVSHANSLTGALAFEAMSTVLKRRGIVASAAQQDSIAPRLKDLVGGSLNHAVLDGQGDELVRMQAAANVLAGGSDQLVKYGVRGTMQNTSLKHKELTGKELHAKRVVTSSSACKYCQQLSGMEFPLGAKVTQVHFHDHCNCELVLV